MQSNTCKAPYQIGQLTTRSKAESMRCEQKAQLGGHDDSENNGGFFGYSRCGVTSGSALTNESSGLYTEFP